MPIKTSISHPLQIDAVEPLRKRGLIGMTICPGRKGSSMAGGSWDRDLSLDLDVVRAWKPDIVIAMLEPHEFPALGIPEFRRDVLAAGLPWVFAPVVDAGVPDEAFLRNWERLGPRVRNTLRQNGRVLIHCRAGLGRTGLLAASLLVGLGERAEDAILRVRAARPGAIETRPQEAFVRAQRSFESAIPRDTRIEGMMFGGAIGDALGSAFEFCSAKAIAAKLGEAFAWHYAPAIPGSLLYPREPGQPTDDTAMALSVASVVADGPPFSAARFAEAFLSDLDRTSGRYGDIFWNGGPGGATTRALFNLRSGADPTTAGHPDAGGNGTAMRAHPIGVLSDRNDVLEVAALQAKVTHGEPAAAAAAQTVAALIYDALQGLEAQVELPVGINRPAKMIDAWYAAHAGIERGAIRLPLHLLDADMAAWNTVAAAHAISYIFQDDPKRAIAAAAASGKDTDTVASIVGAIVGARVGLDVLDGDWVTGLPAATATEIRRTADRLSLAKF